jgi:hypothetical protein
MLSDSLTWRLLREIWSKRKPPTPNVVAISTRSVVALRHFLDAERAFARWDGPDAYEAYKRAIEADTTFWFAHYRYRVAHGWFGPGPLDTTIANRLSRHLAELPPREQRLLRAVDSTQTATDRRRKLEALLDENPDYTPAIIEYGDFIAHQGGLARWDVRDAIPYFRRLTQLMPGDLTLLSHYGPLCSMAGDRSCGQQVRTQLDSIMTLEPEPPFIARLLFRGAWLALTGPSPSWADSLARLAGSPLQTRSVRSCPWSRRWGCSPNDQPFSSNRTDCTSGSKRAAARISQSQCNRWVPWGEGTWRAWTASGPKSPACGLLYARFLNQRSRFRRR